MTTFHMAYFIKKCMSNTLPTMKILQRRGYATTNLCPLCGVALETIQHLYQCTHEESCGRQTVSVYALQKWLESWNTYPYIAIILSNTLLYITGEKNDFPQCQNLNLHSDILRIGWPYIIIGIITTSITRTKKMYFTHIGSKRTGLKWSSQLITQIWKLIHRQCLHHSKLKHVGEALDNPANDLILDSKIKDKHEQVQDTLPNRYNPYFGTPLSMILDTSINARKNWYQLINTARKTTCTDN